MRVCTRISLLMKFGTFACRSLSLSGVAVAVAADSRFISPRRRLFITFYFHLRAFLPTSFVSWLRSTSASPPIRLRSSRIRALSRRNRIESFIECEQIGVSERERWNFAQSNSPFN